MGSGTCITGRRSTTISWSRTGLFDHLGAAYAPEGTASTDTGAVAMMDVQSSKPHNPRFEARGLTIMRLLRPAFCAAIVARRKDLAQPAELHMAPDAFTYGARILTPDGRVLHSNHAFARMLADDPSRDMIEFKVRSVAAAAAAATRLP